MQVSKAVVIVNKIKESADRRMDYNALTDEYMDMLKGGIVDPTKVTRSALQNASVRCCNGSHNREHCCRQARPCRLTQRLRLLWQAQVRAECINPRHIA